MDIDFFQDFLEWLNEFCKGNLAKGKSGKLLIEEESSFLFYPIDFQVLKLSGNYRSPTGVSNLKRRNFK